jgi:putative addiction module killer protein
MKRIRRTSIYKKWFKKLKDNTGKYLIDSRIYRLRQGNAGDSGPIGEGLSEMRIHFGPGYRIYYKDTGTEIIILFCGGDKSTQEADIARAKEIAKLPLEDEEEKNGKDNRS